MLQFFYYSSNFHTLCKWFSFFPAFRILLVLRLQSKGKPLFRQICHRFAMYGVSAIWEFHIRSKSKGKRGRVLTRFDCIIGRLSVANLFSKCSNAFHLNTTFSKTHVQTSLSKHCTLNLNSSKSIIKIQKQHPSTLFCGSYF